MRPGRRRRNRRLSHRASSSLARAAFTLVELLVVIGIIAVFLMTLVLRAHKNPVVTGVDAMIGEIGIARTAVDGHGKVFVHGELWNAMAKSAIPEGTRVRVRGVDGMRVVVEAAE